jgi:hypothetical protein
LRADEDRRLTFFALFGPIVRRRRVAVEICRPRVSTPILSRVDPRVYFVDVLVGVSGVRRRALAHHGEGLGPDR